MPWLHFSHDVLTASSSSPVRKLGHGIGVSAMTIVDDGSESAVTSAERMGRDASREWRAECTRPILRAQHDSWKIPSISLARRLGLLAKKLGVRQNAPARPRHPNSVPSLPASG